MKRSITVACVQAEPVILDKRATFQKQRSLVEQAANAGASLVVFPETFVSAYPSSIWAQGLARDAQDARDALTMLIRQSVEVPGEDCDTLGDIARTSEVWMVTGVNETDPARPGTLYNTLLYHAPNGRLMHKHRKMIPTNHERMVWGRGAGDDLGVVDCSLGRIGGLICWENYMPLARFALYQAGVELYIASTADDRDTWQSTLIHIARESRCFVISPCHLQRASSYPERFPARARLEGADYIGLGGSAVLSPTGEYLAGPIYQEESILYAELHPEVLIQARQRFDPAGHYHRPDVFHFSSKF